MHNRQVPTGDVQLEFPTGQSVSYDYNAFDEFINSHGVTLIHYRAMRCPIGLSDKFDVRKTQNCHLECSNGFIYTRGGEVTCNFTSNQKRENAQDIGFLPDANAQITIPIHYDCGIDDKISLARYDRMYLCEENITVQNWELIEAHATGLDRLSFPAVEVIDLIDNRGTKYTQGDQFVLENGKIRWTSQNQPGQDIDSGKGRVYTVRYTYRPFWYIKSLTHEIRVTQSNFLAEGSVAEIQREVRQLPYLASIQREYMYENETKDPNVVDSNNARITTVPADGSFGVR